MDESRILALQFALSLTAYALIGAWFVGPWLARRPRREALMVLVLPHAFRHVGVSLLVPGLVGPELPERFARGTASGDLLTVGLALLALVWLRLDLRGSLAVVWVFNGVGLADLLLNLARGVRLGVADQLGAAWFGPAFVVPLMLVTHLMIFVFLLRGEGRSADPAPMGRALAIALMLLLGSGCFVLDELDSAESSVGGKAERARKARRGRAGVDVAEKEKGPSLIERARAFFDAPADGAKDEDTSIPPHPENVLVHCWIDGDAQFTRKFDCQLRGGRVEALPGS